MQPNPYYLLLLIVKKPLFDRPIAPPASASVSSVSGSGRRVRGRRPRPDSESEDRINKIIISLTLALLMHACTDGLEEC
eukprot:scaffold284657_cov37-Tisochrysis_lutea.AAC.2